MWRVDVSLGIVPHTIHAQTSSTWMVNENLIYRIRCEPQLEDLCGVTTRHSTVSCTPKVYLAEHVIRLQSQRNG